MSDSTPITYKDAGVDIAAQDAALAQAKASVRETFTPGVLSDMGLFGGLFDLAKVGSEGHVLVASADGVGTKLEVAKRAGIHDTVGRDLVQHCINDILVQGARPLFFMDYVGTGRLEPDVVADLVKGCAAPCRDNGLALLGGETAEMPGLYGDGDFDLVGFIVGSVDRSKILDGSRVAPGADVDRPAFEWSAHQRILARAQGDLRATRPRDRGPARGARRPVDRGGAARAAPLVPEPPLAPPRAGSTRGARAHHRRWAHRQCPARTRCTTDAVIDLGTWEVPPLFEMIVEAAGIDRDEAFQALNMGIGMVLFVSDEHLESVEAHLAREGEDAVRIGRVEEAADAGHGRVRWA